MSQENRGLLVILGVLLVVLLVGPVFMGGMMGAGFTGPGMMGWGYSSGAAGTTNGWVWGLGMGLGGLMMLAFWGAIIAGIVLLARSAAAQLRGGSGSNNSEDPLTILRRRYAAGEIDQATFERMRSELGDPRQPAAANGRIEPSGSGEAGALERVGTIYNPAEQPATTAEHVLRAPLLGRSSHACQSRRSRATRLHVETTLNATSGVFGNVSFFSTYRPSHGSDRQHL